MKKYLCGNWNQGARVSFDWELLTIYVNEFKIFTIWSRNYTYSKFLCPLIHYHTKALLLRKNHL